MRPVHRAQEIKALAGARAFPPLILVLFHFCEGHGYRGVDQPVCHHDWWAYFFTCAKWFDLPVSRGYLWVEFFFALSGFILVHVYGARAWDFWKGKAYVPFIQARLARLYPVHLFTLITMLYLMWVLNALADLGGYTSIFHQPYHPMNTWPSFVANLFLVQAWNLFPWLTWNGASWFVSVEFLLCLLFPVYVLLSRGSWWRGLALVGVGISALVLLAQGSHHGLDITFHNGIFRGMAGFAAGVGLAMLYREAKLRGADKLPDWAFDAAQAVVLGYLAWTTYCQGWAFSPRDVWFVSALYLLIFVLAFDRGFLARALARPLPLKLGEWSYAIYMGQTFWLQAVRYFEQRWYPPGETVVLGLRFSDVMWWAEPFLLMGVCIGWGALLTIYVELPANKRLRRMFAQGKPRSAIASR
ncbi:MAG TPA: acyltransferase [Rhizomicrobium sp.]|nr:acyltransferase [Rhizomicrobium sp.]